MMPAAGPGDLPPPILFPMPALPTMPPTLPPAPTTLPTDPPPPPTTPAPPPTTTAMTPWSLNHWEMLYNEGIAFYDGTTMRIVTTTMAPTSTMQPFMHPGPFMRPWGLIQSPADSATATLFQRARQHRLQHVDQDACDPFCAMHCASAAN